MMSLDLEECNLNLSDASFSTTVKIGVPQIRARSVKPTCASFHAEANKANVGMRFDGMDIIEFYGIVRKLI